MYQFLKKTKVIIKRDFFRDKVYNSSFEVEGTRFTFVKMDLTSNPEFANFMRIY